MVNIKKTMAAGQYHEDDHAIRVVLTATIKAVAALRRRRRRRRKSSNRRGTVACLRTRKTVEAVFREIHRNIPMKTESIFWKIMACHLYVKLSTAMVKKLHINALIH